MLDQMVESRSHAGEGKTRNSLLLITGVLILILFIGGFLTSLFAQQIGVGGDGLELSTLVAPVPLPDEAPPEPEEQPEKKQQNKNPDVDIRKEIIANMQESPPKPPEKISTVKNTTPARRLGVTTLRGATNQNTQSAPDGNLARSTNQIGTGIGTGDPNTSAAAPPKQSAPPPVKAPPPPPPAKPKPKPVPKRISGGVVNGKARSLPKPAYPPAARAVRAKGKVNVSVVISKSGKVISATATSGHPLLRAAAASAARRASFAPTLLSGQPVEVSGTIVYNFN